MNFSTFCPPPSNVRTSMPCKLIGKNSKGNYKYCFFFFCACIDCFTLHYITFRDDEGKRILLETTFRSFLTDHLINESKLGSPDLSRCQDFVSFGIQASRVGLCSPTLPILLLTDLFDLLTLDHSQVLFSSVEDNVKIWKEEQFFGIVKNHLLRICNDLLRRLSRTQNTVFCGRILLFLARFFPISDRSGLNVISEFNLENTTTFSEEDIQEDETEKDSIIIEEDQKK